MSNFEKLKAAFKASTQDPWSSSFTEWKLLRNNVMCNNYFVAQVFVDGDCQVAANIRLANAEFIILAYNMMPKILSDLERLQKLEAQLEQVKELAIKLETALAMSLMREQLVVPMLNTESV